MLRFKKVKGGVFIHEKKKYRKGDILELEAVRVIEPFMDQWEQIVEAPPVEEGDLVDDLTNGEGGEGGDPETGAPVDGLYQIKHKGAGRYIVINSVTEKQVSEGTMEEGAAAEMARMMNESDNADA